MTKFRFGAMLLAIGSLVVMTASIASAADPRGNNGTVKVDGVEVDRRANANEPHVGCDFSVEWYGFDENAVSTVTFETQAPTGTRVLLNDVVQLDGDDSSGGGSPEGWDGAASYRLSFDPSQDSLQPNQGYHISMTITTTGASGSDVKHKTFWVTGCDGGEGGEA